MSRSRSTHTRKPASARESLQQILAKVLASTRVLVLGLSLGLALAACSSQPGLSACYRACNGIKACNPNYDEPKCIDGCDDAPASCKEDPAIAEALDNCTDGLCVGLGACLTGVGVTCFATARPDP